MVISLHTDFVLLLPSILVDLSNILAGPLISLSETIASMLKPGAKIGLSGILAWQGEDVVEAYSEYFNDVKVEKEKGGWVLVSGTKK